MVCSPQSCAARHPRPGPPKGKRFVRLCLGTLSLLLVGCLVELNPQWDRPGTESSGTSATDSSASGGSEDGTADSGGGAQVRYDPVIFACSRVEGQPDLEGCMSYAQGGISVDLRTNNGDEQDGPEHNGFIRFDLDDQLVGQTVTRVRLRMRTRERTSSGSPSSGELWASEAFDLASLSQALPAPVGTEPIGPDIGAVEDDANYFMVIDPGAVQPNQSLYLRYVPLSNDGLWLNDVDEPGPPKLIIDIEP